jgi:hypothetical protein
MVYHPHQRQMEQRGIRGKEKWDKDEAMANF